MDQKKKKEAGRAAARRRGNTKVEYKVARATAADARKIHNVIVIIDDIYKLLKKKKWIYGIPARNPLGIGARYEAVLKDVKAVSKQVEAAVRKEMKLNK